MRLAYPFVSINCKQIGFSRERTATQSAWVNFIASNSVWFLISSRRIQCRSWQETIYISMCSPRCKFVVADVLQRGVSFIVPMCDKNGNCCRRLVFFGAKENFYVTRIHFEVLSATLATHGQNFISTWGANVNCRRKRKRIHLCWGSLICTNGNDFFLRGTFFVWDFLPHLPLSTFSPPRESECPWTFNPPVSDTRGVKSGQESEGREILLTTPLLPKHSGR